MYRGAWLLLVMLVMTQPAFSDEQTEQLTAEQSGDAEKKVLTVGFWLLYSGGILGMVTGLAWFIRGKRKVADYATAGIGGALTVALAALVALVRNRL